MQNRASIFRAEQTAGGFLETRLAEHAAVDLAHPVFKVDAVVGFVQVGEFAVLNGRDTEGAGDFAD